MKKPTDPIENPLGGATPAWERFANEWKSKTNLQELGKFSPEELLGNVRTSEEYFQVIKHLTREGDQSGASWWKLAQEVRVKVQHNPSFYGFDEAGKGLYGVPIDPVVYARDARKGLLGKNVRRNLAGKFATYEQAAGKIPLFKKVGGVIEGAQAAKALTFPKLKNPLIIDFETTGLLGESRAQILSLTYQKGLQGKAESLFAHKSVEGKFGEVIEKKILPIYETEKAAAVARGEQVLSEEELINKTIGLFGSHEGEILGYNQRRFDVPKFFERAALYGKEEAARASLAGKSLVDIEDYVLSGLSQKLAPISPQWDRRMFEEIGLNPQGFRLEHAAKAYGVDTAGMTLHGAGDVPITARVAERLAAGTTPEVEWGIREGLYKTIQDIPETIHPVGRVYTEAEMAVPFHEWVGQNLKNRTVAKSITQESKGSIFDSLKRLAANSYEAIGSLLERRPAGAKTWGKYALTTGATAFGMSMLTGTAFAQGVASSVAFDFGKRIATNRGYGGWKGIAAGVGAGLATSFLWEKVFNSGAFSGKDDAWNTIEGLRHEGMKTGVRQSLTDFGSGYQGPNPWLNAQEELPGEVPLYQTMRASKLGSYPGELYKYYTQEEQPSESLAASAAAGTALHKVFEAEAYKKAIDVESFVYDPKTGITGHIDIVQPGGPAGIPLDIKSVSSERFRQVQKSGAFYKNISQVNWYAGMLGAPYFDLLYVNRENIKEQKRIRTPFSQARLEKDVRRFQTIQARVQQDIAAGQLNPDALPKGPSIETLQEQSKQQEYKNMQTAGQLSYWKKIYAQEMDYLHSVQPENKFSGKDDNYNSIEGLRHGGLAERVRRTFTEFGSGWDALRGLAKKIFGEADDAFSLFRKSTAFQESLKNASLVRELNYGATGSLSLMKGVVHGEEFHFVKKVGLVPEREIEALRAIEHGAGPSVYASKPGEVFMEYFPGASLTENEVLNNPGLKEKIAEAYRELHKTGWLQRDPNLGNVMKVITPEGKETIGIVDFGAARHKSSFDTLSQFTEEAEHEIRVITGEAESKFTKKMVSAPRQAESWSFDDIVGNNDGLHPKTESSLGALAIKKNSDFGSGIVEFAKRISLRIARSFKNTLRKTPTVEAPLSVLARVEQKGNQIMTDALEQTINREKSASPVVGNWTREELASVRGKIPSTSGELNELTSRAVERRRVFETALENEESWAVKLAKSGDEYGALPKLKTGITNVPSGEEGLAIAKAYCDYDKMIIGVGKTHPMPPDIAMDLAIRKAERDALGLQDTVRQIMDSNSGRAAKNLRQASEGMPGVGLRQAHGAGQRHSRMMTKVNGG